MICLLTNVAKLRMSRWKVPGQGHFYEQKYSYTVILSFLDLISKQARLNAAVSAFLSFIKSWHDFKVARYSFSGPITLKFEHKLRRHKQRFGKIATTVVLDEDENLL